MNAIILSAIWGIVMMFSSIWLKNKNYFRHVAIAGIVLILLANCMDARGYSFFRLDTFGLLVYDHLSYFFLSVLLISTAFYFLISGGEITRQGKYSAEYFVLIFFVLCGISILMFYNSLLMLFLGVEIMSIPLYILTGADKRNLKSNEASLKYFLMGAFSTGIMLMGIALIYGGTGSFALNVPRGTAVPGYYLGSSFLEIAGLIFLFASMAFKVSAAPFHFWTPDVYDGSPTVFTSFMATIVKAAGFYAFFKLADVRFTQTSEAIDWKLILSFVIVLTLLFGNITAVFQQSVKRMLAYSSIAQAGFMLFALFAKNDLARHGLILYAVAYSLSTIGIFGIMYKMKDYSFEGYNGLAKKHPVLALSNTIFLLSLAGIPLTAGFLAKYYMLAAAISTGTYSWLVILAVIFAAVSVYYYFRLIQAMYFKEGNPDVAATSPLFKYLLATLAGILVILGAFPQLLFNWFYFG
jgi:NADH-quinone oxidoreductase subunit N